LPFEGFNKKFWGRRLEEMPADWGKLRGSSTSPMSESSVFQARLLICTQRVGSNPLFDKMLDGFDIRYGTPVHHIEIDGEGPQVVTSNLRMPADLIIVTAPIDAVFEFRYGPLEWTGYRIEVETVHNPEGAPLGLAPDGVPFSWVYTPWAETPICRTTDFGVIHHGYRGSDRPESCVFYAR
jgi:UDP-galactopyranose mutase